MARARNPVTRRIEAVERAVAVLDALAAARELGTNELAREIGVHASSVSRLLATLEAGGLVVRIAETGRYRLGLRLAELGHVALGGFDLRELARPHLRALVARTGETATLSVPGEGEAITIDFVQSPQFVASIARLGRPSIGHATAVGKVMLAFGGGEATGGSLQRFTEATITEPAQLAREIERVRDQGWAAARSEREPDLNAVAVPVRGGTGDLVAILGLQGPGPRFVGRAMDDARDALRVEARALAAALGWRE